MLNQKTKNKKLKKFLKNVRGATVTATFRRRPYPPALAGGTTSHGLSTGFLLELSTAACE
jgi:hypothetical protein